MALKGTVSLSMIKGLSVLSLRRHGTYRDSMVESIGTFRGGGGVTFAVGVEGVIFV